MRDVLQRELNELEFAIISIVTVAERRKDFSASATCYDLSHVLRDSICCGAGEERTATSIAIADEALFRAYHTADTLAMVTMAEIREVLYPVQCIKQKAREFGERFFSNYFGWLDNPEQYTPEQLMGLLEGDLRKLEQAKSLLTNISISIHTQRAE